MKQKLGMLLILLSVGLNAAFVATWFAHRIPGRGGACHGIRTECPMHIQLGATEPQWREIETRLDMFRESSKPLCAEIQRHRTDLLNLVAAPAPDRAAIRAKQEQIIEGQRQMQENVIENLMGLSAALTPEQRKRLFDLLRERSQCPGPAMPLSGNKHGGRM